ncbi:DUF1707 domain-containing protein, partial [Mycobacterium sp. 852014-52450_SCH5900713]|uniref:DUF1707 SHOCT-like domain-containing protein n=1 Tax=Mycobacterium sp. 852014-52450_SCH5900713 TaxID=1834116 RepID=UPI000A60988C
MIDDTRASDNDRNRTCEALDAALGDGQLSTEEHRERVAAATRATTLGELRSLVTDLQIRPAAARPPSTPAGINRRRAWIAVAVALVLLGAGLAWGLQRDTPSAPAPSAAPTAAPSSSAAMTTKRDDTAFSGPPLAQLPSRYSQLT